MCQVSMYMREDEQENLVKENITHLAVNEDEIVIKTLFEGGTSFKNTTVDYIDFSAGKIVLTKQ